VNVVNSTVAQTQQKVDTVGMPRKTASKSSLGQVLRQAREAQVLSLRQLAALLEVAPSQITRWERDDYAPSTDALLQLVRVLELTPKELFALAGVSLPAEPRSLPAMLRREYDLPPEAIAEIQRNIERVARKYQQRKAKSPNQKGGQP
jgi:transcriptional regulator with XRE-family HTH domain